MNLKELIAEVNKDIDDSLQNADITGWINRGLDELSIFAKFKKKISIPLPANTTDLPLPNDIVEIIKISDGSQEVNYEKWGDIAEINEQFNTDKTLTLYYYARLPHLKNPNDVPVLPLHFHDLLVLYAVAKAKYQDEELEMYEVAWTDYLSRQNDFKAYQSTEGEINQVRLVT